MTTIQILGLIFASAFGIAVALFRRYYLPEEMASTDYSVTDVPLSYEPVKSDIPSPILPNSLPSTPIRVYNIAKISLGKHLTLDSAIPSEVGCAEAVSTILKNAGYDVGLKGIPSVVGLIQWMISKGFKETHTPIPGCIITAHGVGNGITNFSHCGIVLKNGIASNDSTTGKFNENYTMISWNNYFSTVNTRFFIPV